MYSEILTKQQQRNLPLVQSFSKNFGLVGGTAIALIVGHRRSIDFDLFSLKEFNNLEIRKEILKIKKIERVLRDKNDEYTVLINSVKFTFLYYPFPIKFSKNFNKLIKLPDLLTLAAMKAYALGRRAKWKDYIDLYFIMKKYFSLNQITKKAKNIFGKEFNEKIFRVQLAYFKDIDYSESIIYLKGQKVANEKIKKELIKFSLS